MRPTPGAMIKAFRGRADDPDKADVAIPACCFFFPPSGRDDAPGHFFVSSFLTLMNPLFFSTHNPRFEDGADQPG